MVCNKSWHLPGNPKLVWHPDRLMKEGGSVDLSMDTLHIKCPLVLFGCIGSALTLPLFLLSPRIIMLCHCSSTLIHPFIHCTNKMFHNTTSAAMVRMPFTNDDITSDALDPMPHKYEVTTSAVLERFPTEIGALPVL